MRDAALLGLHQATPAEGFIVDAVSTADSRRRTARDFALIGRVWAEVGAGRITEAYIVDAETMGTDGYYNGSGRITINPAHQVVDTVIHECLHRAFPHWTERYVRRTTTQLRNKMNDHEIRAMYEEDQRRKRKRKRPLQLGD